MSPSLSQFQETLQQAGLEGFFPPNSLPALVHFSQKMLQWNESLNLTRWTSDSDFLTFHLLDSAFGIPEIKPHVREAARWMDLGTGCGFPGAVLAAAFPTLEVALMDSVAKKTKALEDCLQGTGWKARVLTGRAEELGRDPEHREAWDGITARAVADFRVVLEYAAPLLRTGGYLVNWMTAEQSTSVDNASQALATLQCKIVKKATYSLPSSTQARVLVIVEKLGKTPAGYPRAAGHASKKPL